MGGLVSCLVSIVIFLCSVKVTGLWTVYEPKRPCQV